MSRPRQVGGDEFTVLLPEVASPDAAEAIGRRIVARLGEPFIIQGQEVRIGASVGITLFPEHGADHDKLLKNADLAMYAAKESGRQTVSLYCTELERIAVERLTLERELRAAIANGELAVFYQPKVSCADGRITGAEALVRWKHPARGLLSPGEFLAIAEETGLIVDLGWHVLEQALMGAAKLGDAGQPISIAVNVSALQFEHVDFVQRVTDALWRSGLPPRLLELELTESIAMRDPERLIGRIKPLRDLGVRFAIDDFGTGYSSLSYLTRLPIDTVKIDRSFVKTVQQSANDKTLVTMILRMAESLQFETVAEGVEREEDFDFVREHGASTAQGYLFSPPLPFRQFAELCGRFGARPAGEAEEPAQEALSAAG